MTVPEPPSTPHLPQVAGCSVRDYGKKLAGDTAPLEEVETDEGEPVEMQNSAEKPSDDCEKPSDDFDPALLDMPFRTPKEESATSMREMSAQLSVTPHVPPARQSKSSRSGTGKFCQSPSTSSPAPSQTSGPLVHALLSLRAKDSVRTSKHSVEDDYEVLGELGRGAMGVVQVARSMKSNQEVAIKSIPIPKDPTALKDLELELNIARRLKHPNIVRLDEVIKNGEGYHLVMELCTGGDLCCFMEVKHSSPGGYLISQHTFCNYTLQMLSSLAYLHHHRIMHRDIKAENYVMETGAPDSPLKLTDFGLACFFKKGVFLTSKCGSLYTMAPQVYQRKYTEKCDVWSVGVTAFVLGAGARPFVGEDERAIEAAIMEGQPNFDLIWLNYDPNAERLVRQLLTVNENDRPTAKAALVQNRWLEEYANETAKPCCFLLA